MKNLGEQLLDAMGGEKNIIEITHCATRLRPTLLDRSVVDVEAIRRARGVMGVVDTDSSFQIVIGTNVSDIYEEVLAISSLKREEALDVDEEDLELLTPRSPVGERKWFSTFIETVVSIFSPLLPILAGSGIFRGLAILSTNLGLLSAESQTYLLITSLTGTVFTFLPILISYTSAKRFKADPIIAAVIMGSLIVPGFAQMMNGRSGTVVHYFGLPISVFDYTSQVIPAIITTWFQSIIEHWIKARIPTALRLVAIPTLLLIVMFPLAACIIGPAGNYLSIAIAGAVSWLTGLNTIVTGAVVGGIWNILIMFGIHWAPNTMVVIPQVAKTGSSPLSAYAGTANFGMAGAALAIFLRTRDKSLKSFSLSAITSVALSGIVEPAIYGLGVRFKTPLVAGCLGAAIGGAFMGAFHAVGHAFVFAGLTTIPAFAGPTLWAYVVGQIIAFVSAMLIMFLLSFKEDREG